MTMTREIENEHHTKPLTENELLKKSLHKLLGIYWGRGDGEKPPRFIIEAAKLCNYNLEDYFFE